MNQKQSVILYQAYGAKSIHQQVLFSILSLHFHLKGNYEGIQIVIYTDKPNFYNEIKNKIPCSFETLTDKLIEFYKGEQKFVHRVKIEIIRDCFEKYKKNIFYLDSDTYFTSSPYLLLNQIDDNTSIMNTDDYDLNNANALFENEDWLLIRRAIRDFEYVLENKKMKIPLDTRMWNAGVIGIAYNNRQILNEVIDLTDQIYSNIKVFTAEQFAFSFYLQNRTILVSSGNVIFHYWRNFIGNYWKDLYSYHFNRFFLKYNKLSLNKKAELAYDLTTRHDILIKSLSKSFYERMLRRIKLVVTILINGKI